jgi:hypothetical protein
MALSLNSLNFSVDKIMIHLTLRVLIIDDTPQCCLSDRISHSRAKGKTYE